MSHSAIYQQIRELPQCIEVQVKHLEGHATAGILNALNGLTFIETTHTAGLLGRGPTTYRFSIVRPQVFGELDTRAMLTERDAGKVRDAWAAQAAATGLLDAALAAAG